MKGTIHRTHRERERVWLCLHSPLFSLSSLTSLHSLGDNFGQFSILWSLENFGLLQPCDHRTNLDICNLVTTGQLWTFANLWNKSLFFVSSPTSFRALCDQWQSLDFCNLVPSDFWHLQLCEANLCSLFLHQHLFILCDHRHLQLCETNLPQHFERSFKFSTFDLWWPQSGGWIDLLLPTADHGSEIVPIVQLDRFTIHQLPLCVLPKPRVGRLHQMTTVIVKISSTDSTNDNNNNNNIFDGCCLPELVVLHLAILRRVRQHRWHEIDEGEICITRYVLFQY